jgi:hypothetical protein
MLNNKDNCNLLGLDFENIHNIFPGFISISLWILSKANPFKRFSPIVVLKYVYMRFSVEKDSFLLTSSLVHVVTGNVAKISKSSRMFGNSHIIIALYYYYYIIYIIVFERNNIKDKIIKIKIKTFNAIE